MDDAAAVTILRLNRDLAENRWRQGSEAILEGKTEYRADKYSYEGMIYRFQRAKKGPCSIEEREKCRRLSEELYEAEQKLEEYEEKRSQEALEEAFQRIKADVEAGTRLHGPRSKEELDKEFEELTEQFKEAAKKLRQ